MKKYFVYDTNNTINNFLFEADSKNEIIDKATKLFEDDDFEEEPDIELVIVDNDNDLKSFYHYKGNNRDFSLIFDIITWHKL